MGEYFVCRGKESPEGKAGIRGREEAEKLIIVGYRRGQSLTYVLYTDCASIIVFPLQYRPTLLSTGSLNRFIIKPFEFPLAPTGQSYPFLESIYVIGASSRPRYRADSTKLGPRRAGLCPRFTHTASSSHHLLASHRTRQSMPASVNRVLGGTAS
jgi:hypothetical protein